MQRTIMKDLISWKNSTRRKPLILRGARQVGKTWILKEFGESQFSDLAYVHLEDNAAMRLLFDGSLEPRRLLDGLAAYVGKSIDKNTLIVLDEVQAVPRALTALKYFCEDMPEQPIAVAGSLLGVAFHSGISFPVGKVDFLDLYPMTFAEFLVALDHEVLSEAISSANIDTLSIFTEQLTDLLKQYTYIGGMPEAVLEYSETKNLNRVRFIQQAIVTAYEADFSKHAPKDVAERCRQVWQSAPTQLAKANKKFTYGAIRQGGRGRDYEGAIQFLADSGLITRVWRITKPGIPLEAYKDTAAYKLFLVDIGLLGAMSNLDSMSIIDGNTLFEEFKGAIAEQLVAQELRAQCGYNLYYWSAEKSSGEIDFIFQNNGQIFPTEVKAAENLRSKSLASFCQKYGLNTGVRLSLSGFKSESWMQNVPLYAIGSLPVLLS